MPKYHQRSPKERNYVAEARELIKGLSQNQLYKLYEIVQNQKRRSQTPERDLELNAVEAVIDGVSGLDQSKLHSLRTGFKSSMAAEARAKDGNTTVNKRRV